MRRVAVILCTFLVLVGTVGVVAYRSADKETRNAGLALFLHRWTSIRRLLTLEERPAVVWVGDSTIMPAPGYPSYVWIVQKQVSEPAQGPGVAVEAAGFDFYAYWSLAGRIAAVRPKLVVLIANLRSFGLGGDGPLFNDLTGEIDLADLPRMLTLPYYIRGMTASGLLMARALRTELGEDVFLNFEGTRRSLQDGAAWDVLGPAKRPETKREIAVRAAALMERIRGGFDGPIARESPLVEFAGATVSRLARDGITVLVVVTPFSWEAVGPKYYDPARFAARIEILRAVVEENGGYLIDLHHALGAKSFRDKDCHFTVDGATEMADLLTPEIHRLLVAHNVWAAGAGREH